MEHQSFSQLSLWLHDRILLVTIKNPPHNYLTGNFYLELNSCREIILSDAVDAVVLTGEGKLFSKGFNIQEVLPASSSFNNEIVLFANDVYSFFANLNKPVIAAINGTCLGGGLELALASHIRLCAEKSMLGLPEVSGGLVPGLGGIRLMGEARALEMLLIGDFISAQRAYELNLVNRVFPKKDFLVQVMAFVKMLLATRYEAIQHILELVRISRPENEDANILKSANRFTELLLQARKKINEIPG
jgi:enoyl-CoA hydratase/carnithine racemase